MLQTLQTTDEPEAVFTMTFRVYDAQWHSKCGSHCLSECVTYSDIQRVLLTLSFRVCGQNL